MAFNLKREIKMCFVLRNSFKDVAIQLYAGKKMSPKITIPQITLWDASQWISSST